MTVQHLFLKTTHTYSLQPEMLSGHKQQQQQQQLENVNAAAGEWHCTSSRMHSWQPVALPSGALGGHPLPLKNLRLTCQLLKAPTLPLLVPRPQAQGQSTVGRRVLCCLEGQPLLGPLLDLG